MPARSVGQAAGGDLRAVEPGHRRARRVGTRSARPAASDAVRHAAASGSTPITRDAGARRRSARPPRPSEPTPTGTSSDVERACAASLGEQRRVAVDDPARRPGRRRRRRSRARPARAPRRGGRARPRPRRSPSTTTTSAPSPAIASRRAGDRARGQEDAAAQPAQRGDVRDGAAVVARAGRDERVRVRALAQRALDRPRRAEHLERRQAEPVGLVLERDGAEAELGRDAGRSRSGVGRVAGQRRVEGARLVARRRAPRPGRSAGLTSALTRRPARATPTSVRATRLGVGEADPLLGRVRALAARAEHDGRDAGGGDERGVGPVARAADRRRARRARRRRRATARDDLGVRGRPRTARAPAACAARRELGSAARQRVEQRVELGLDVARRSRRAACGARARSRSAPGSSTARRRPRSATRAPSRGRAAGALRSPSAASSAPSAVRTGPALTIASTPRCGREPCAARPVDLDLGPDEALVRDDDARARSAR